MTFSEIFQDSLPISPWADPGLARLPGILPLEGQDWNIVDEAFDAQMAYAEHLLDTSYDTVFSVRAEAEKACEEVLKLAIRNIANNSNYRLHGNAVQRPDGKVVRIDEYHPLEAARRLMQQDLCLMGPSETEHVLQAAALCFPANWRLSEKIGRPLMEIHEPVEEYTSDIGKRVQRLFDMIREGRGLWRANWLMYSESDLHQPRRFTDRKDVPIDNFFMRVERQAMTYLPQSGFTLFGIHTFLVKSENLSQHQLNSLDIAHGHKS